MIERKKLLSYVPAVQANGYFWRVHTGAELDYVEERGGKVMGYEFKLNKKKVREPKTWLETYNNAKYELVNKDNYLDFLRFEA